MHRTMFSRGIKASWSTMWIKREVNKHNNGDYLYSYEVGNSSRIMVPSADEFDEVIQYVLNWKAAGPDGIYNFSIKRLKSLYSYSDYRHARRSQSRMIPAASMQYSANPHDDPLRDDDK